MDKLTKTIFLLILIAISIQTYFVNGESHSQEATVFAVPLTINALLFTIYLTHKENTRYKRVVENLLIFCFVISAIYCAFFLYAMQLGKAYRN